MISWNFVDETGSDLNKYIIQHLDELGDVLGEETVKLLRDATITQAGTPLTAEKLNEIISNINTLGTNKVDKVKDKSLVADSEITKLASVETGAQKNVIEAVAVDGVDLTVTNKKVNITLPKKLPNPNLLTFKVDGKLLGTYDGSAGKTFELITTHTHTEEDIISSVVTMTAQDIYSYAYPKGKTIFVNRSTLTTFRIYPDGYSGVTHERGTEIALFRIGTGDVEIKAVTVGDVTPQILSYGGKKFINAQHQAVMLIKDTANTWRLFGALKS